MALHTVLLKCFPGILLNGHARPSNWTTTTMIKYLYHSLVFSALFQQFRGNLISPPCCWALNSVPAICVLFTNRCPATTNAPKNSGLIYFE